MFGKKLWDSNNGNCNGIELSLMANEEYSNSIYRSMEKLQSGVTSLEIIFYSLITSKFKTNVTIHK